VLPKASDLSTKQANLTKDLVVVEELERVKRKQAERLRSLEADIKDWRDRAKEPEAFEHNELAREVVQLSATAAIEFLLENRSTLTQSHRDSLADLGVDVVLPDTPNPVLYREDLIGSYPEADVDSLLNGRDGLTAMEGWDILYGVLCKTVSKLIEARDKHKKAVKGIDEERRKQEKLVQDERKASEEQRKRFEGKVHELEEKLESQKSTSVSVTAPCFIFLLTFSRTIA